MVGPPGFEPETIPQVDATAPMTLQVMSLGRDADTRPSVALLGELCQDLAELRARSDKVWRQEI